MEELFWNIEMPLVRVLADMELNGVCLDTEALQDTSKIFTERMKQYEQEIYKEAGEEFNISSPKQVVTSSLASCKLWISLRRQRQDSMLQVKRCCRALKARTYRT